MPWLDTKWTSTICPSPAGIQQQNAEASVSVYPNPATDQIVITLQEDQHDMKTISLLSIQGQILGRQQGSKQTTFTFDLSSLKSGVYMIRIQSVNGTYVRKIVKE